MRFYLNYWILAIFYEISFWYYFDSAIFYCWSFLISMFNFFYFSINLLIWSWLSNSCVMKVWNLAVELFFINSFNYSSLRIRAFLYRLTLNESFSRSGFYLNNLHNFFVLYFKIMDNLAISASTKFSYYFSVILVNVARFLTN